MVEAFYVGLKQCFSDLASLQEILPTEYLNFLNAVLIFTSTYGPMLIEMRLTWLLFKYILKFVEGFTPPGSTQFQRSDMVYGWMNVIVRNSKGVVSAHLSSVLIAVRECKVSLFFVFLVVMAMSIYHQP